MKIRLLVLLMFINIGAFAQTTAWSTSPTVTPQTRTFSGSKQIRWIWGTGNIFSLPDTLASFTRKGLATGTNYGAFFNSLGQLVLIPGFTTDSATFFGFSKPLYYNATVPYLAGGVKLIVLPGGEVGKDSISYVPMHKLYSVTNPNFIGDTTNLYARLSVNPNNNTIDASITDVSGVQSELLISDSETHLNFNDATTGIKSISLSPGLIPIYLDNPTHQGAAYLTTPNYQVGNYLATTAQLDSVSNGGAGVNIYNSDGTLAGNRTVNLDNHDIQWQDVNNNTYWGLGEFHTDNSDGLGANGVIDLQPSSFLFQLETPAVKIQSLTGDTTIGFVLRDDKFNKGLVDFTHHTITSGLQLAEIQDIDSIANAKLDSIITANIDNSQIDNLTGNNYLATYNDATGKFSYLTNLLQYNSTTDKFVSVRDWQFNSVNLLGSLNVPNNDNLINNLTVTNDFNLDTSRIRLDGATASDYVLWMSQHGSEVQATQISKLIETDSTNIKTLANKHLRPVITIGQSIVSGKADSLGPTMNADVAIKWVRSIFSVANDPQGPPLDTMYKGSPVPAYLIKMHQLTGERFLDIPLAKGGTSLTSAANTGNGTWQPDVTGNLTTSGLKTIDSAETAARAAGYIIDGPPIILIELSENDANAVQTHTITGADYYNTFVKLSDTLRNNLGSNIAINVISAGTRNATGASWGFDTIRNRQYQLANDGYCTIVYRGFRYFKDWGLMSTNPFYTVLHPGANGNLVMGTQAAIGSVSGEPNYILPVATSMVPSAIIPTARALVINPDDGFEEHVGGSFFKTDGTIRYREAMLPQNGIAPGALVFGGSNRNITSDSSKLWVEYDATPGYRAGGVTYFAAHRTAAFIAEGTNAKAVFENYGTAPAAGINFLSSRGTGNTGALPVQAGDIIGFMSAYTNYGTGAAAFGGTTAGINLVARENATSTSLGSGMDFFRTANGDITHQRAGYISQNGGWYLVPNSTGENITIPAKLYAKAESADSATAVFDGGTKPALMLRNNTTTTNQATWSTLTSASIDFNTTTTYNVNKTSGSAENLYGTISLPAYSTGILHSSSAGLVSSSTIASADIAGNAVTYSKMQTGTTARLYGTGSGTAFAEITLGNNLAFNSSTLNITTSHVIFTPVTTGTVTLTNNFYNIINPAGTIAALTITLPSTPANGDKVQIKFTQAVTLVTYSGGTIVDSITSPTAGQLVTFVYDSGTSTWY